MEKNFDPNECRSISVPECAALLGIGKSQMYRIVKEAIKNKGVPFCAISLPGKILVSRKSFLAYLDSLGF